MCMIVDTSRLSVFLRKPNNEDVVPIHDWLNKGWGKVVYSTGGRFEKDINEFAINALNELTRRGKAKLIPQQELKSNISRLEKDSNHKSNDVHVLALAIVSGSRLLYTEDRALKDDFKKGKWRSGRFIISNPRGKLYSSKDNSDLLTADICKSK